MIPVPRITGTINGPSGPRYTLQVALRMGADAIGIDAKPEYLQIAQERAETDWIPVPDRKAKKRKRVTV